jgi:60 kDa SS-A/Ro ribonucleoprotein
MEMLAESEEHHARMLAAFEAAYDEWLAAPGQTSAHAAYLRLREQCPAVRLICIDLQPYGSVQVLDRPDVLNLGGFSDHVFELVAEWAKSPQSSSYWVDEVEAVDLSS